MDPKALIDGVIMYLCFIPILTFHEWAHAWTAWKCGDDTARSLGRVSLNPIVHLDPIGTIVLPALAVFLAASGSGAASFIIGWGKPVPVNPANLRHPNRDDTVVALAGPAMNVVLAFAAVVLAKAGSLAHWPVISDTGLLVAQLSLYLCFFNLLPIPPLDGSSVLRHLTHMSFETYQRLCQIGFILVIIVVQFQAVRQLLASLTSFTLLAMIRSLAWIG